MTYRMEECDKQQYNSQFFRLDNGIWDGGGSSKSRNNEAKMEGIAAPICAVSEKDLIIDIWQKRSRASIKIVAEIGGKEQKRIVC
jgi:hypothetical protein